MGDSIATNSFMLGFAFQRGAIPLSLEAIMKAIDLNGAAIDMNKLAFSWGRLAAHDLQRVISAARFKNSGAQPVKRTLDESIAFRAGFLTDYQELTEIYRLVRASYERGVAVDRGFLRKTAELVRQHTRTLAVETPTGVTRLNADTLERLAGADQPETVKIFNLLKALHSLVEAESARTPYLIPIGDRAQQIAEAFEERLLSAQEALDQLTDLIKEYREAETQRQATDLSPEGFAVFWLLRHRQVDAAQHRLAGKRLVHVAELDDMCAGHLVHRISPTVTMADADTAKSSAMTENEPMTTALVVAQPTPSELPCACKPQNPAITGMATP